MADYGSAFAIAFTIALTWALCGIVGGLLVIRILGAYIERSIGAIECAIFSFVYLALVAAIATSPSVTSKGLAFALLIMVLFGVPWVIQLLERHQDRQFYCERAEQYREAIQQDPMNLAARERLADVLYKEGHLYDAAEELAQLIALSPENQPATYRLKRLLQEIEERKAPPRMCAKCGFANAPERKRCIKCEGSLSLSLEVKEWLVRGGLKRVVRSCAVATLVMTIVFFAARSLPTPVRVVLLALAVPGVMAVQVVYLYHSVGQLASPAGADLAKKR